MALAEPRGWAGPFREGDCVTLIGEGLALRDGNSVQWFPRTGMACIQLSGRPTPTPAEEPARP